MKVKKVLTIFALICMSMICLFGCATVESFRMVTYNKEGKGIIEDSLVVTLDKKKLGSAYDSVKSSINDDMITFMNYVYDWIDSFEADYKEEYLELSKNIDCKVVVEDRSNILTTRLTFTGSKSFALFYGITNVEENVSSKAMDDIGPFLSNILKQEYDFADIGLFLYKYHVLNTPNLAGQIPDLEIEEIGVNYYKKYSHLTGFDMDDIEVSQVFVYPTDTFAYVDDHVYSNADFKEEVDGHTFLGWNLSDKEKNFQVSLYKLYPQTMAWYVVALVISIVFVIVAFVIINIKCKEKIQVKITKSEAEKNE